MIEYRVIYWKQFVEGVGGKEQDWNFAMDKALEEGWLPHGGVSVTASKSSHPNADWYLCSQAMTREKD